METFASLPHEERQRILAKLSKLKALAECQTGNVNETATAAAAMTRLMLEYRIEMAELQPAAAAAPQVVEEEVSPGAKTRSFPGWQNHLVVKIAKAHDCVGYETREVSYMPWGEKVTTVRMVMLGMSEDLARARELFAYTVTAIERLCCMWAPHRTPVALRNDFRRGAAMAIGDKIMAEYEAVRAEEEARARSQGVQSRALAVLDGQLAQVHKAAKQRGVHTVTRSTRAPEKEAYDAGYRAGSKLDLSNGKSGMPVLRG